MKKNLSKKLIAAIFAVTLAFGGGFLVSKSVQPKAEIVLAEDEPTDPEDPTDPIDPEEPIDSGDDATLTEGEGEGAQGDGAAAPEATAEAPASFFEAFINFVKDVFQGMIDEFKALFGIK